MIITLSSNCKAQDNQKQQQVSKQTNNRSDWTRTDNTGNEFRGIPNLTSEQKVKMEDLKVKHLKETTQLENELAEKEAHLKVLETADTFDKVAVDKTIDEIAGIQGKILRAEVYYKQDISLHLTDAQRVYFKSTYLNEQTDKYHVNKNKKSKDSKNNSSSGSSSGPIKK